MSRRVPARPKPVEILPSHGTNRGSNPLRDAMEIRELTGLRAVGQALYGKYAAYMVPDGAGGNRLPIRCSNQRRPSRRARGMVETSFSPARLRGKFEGAPRECPKHLARVGARLSPGIGCAPTSGLEAVGNRPSATTPGDGMVLNERVKMRSKRDMGAV